MGWQFVFIFTTDYDHLEFSIIRGIDANNTQCMDCKNSLQFDYFFSNLSRQFFFIAVCCSSLCKCLIFLRSAVSDTVR